MAVDERPKGLTYRPDFVSEDEESSLLSLFDAMEFDEVRMRGQVARRTVRHFGVDYAYESGELAPADPIPSELEWLRDRCAELAEIEPARLEEALVSRYPPEAGIGWHRDAPMFGSRVIGVSLGSPCRMRLQRRTKAEGRQTFDLELEPRSAYVLSGAARWSWQHSIPKAPDLRYSVTFRSLRDRAAE